MHALSITAPLPCPGSPHAAFGNLRREREKEIKRERSESEKSPMSLVRPAGGVVKIRGASLTPTPPDPARRGKAGQGSRRLARRDRRCWEPRAAQLLREHGVHAEEPPLEASEHRGTREAGLCPFGENSNFHENKNSNNTPFIKERNTIFLKTGIPIIPLS